MTTQRDKNAKHEQGLGLHNQEFDKHVSRLPHKKMKSKTYNKYTIS